jgi:hypothetical protein
MDADRTLINTGVVCDLFASCQRRLAVPKLRCYHRSANPHTNKRIMFMPNSVFEMASSVAAALPGEIATERST